MSKRMLPYQLRIIRQLISFDYAYIDLAPSNRLRWAKIKWSEESADFVKNMSETVSGNLQENRFQFEIFEKFEQ